MDEEVQPTPPRLITVTIHLGPDKDKERRRVKRILGILIANPGDDQFRLRIVGPVKTETRTFPDYNIHFDGEVQQRLIDDCGCTDVEVEVLDVPTDTVE